MEVLDWKRWHDASFLPPASPVRLSYRGWIWLAFIEKSTFPAKNQSSTTPGVTKWRAETMRRVVVSSLKTSRVLPQSTRNDVDTTRHVVISSLKTSRVLPQSTRNDVDMTGMTWKRREQRGNDGISLEKMATLWTRLVECFNLSDLD